MALTDPIEAVVVGHVDIGESSRILRLLTGPEGRIAAMARQARSSRKRYAGLLELGNRLRVRRTRGRGELPNLGEVSLISAPVRARADLLRLAQLAYGVEVCAALAPEHHEAHKLFTLLVHWLDLLEGDEAPGPASREALEAKALTFAGLTPALYRCAACGERLDEPAVWAPGAGGATHARCSGGSPIPLETVARMEVLRRTPLADTPGLPGPAGWWLGDFLQHHLGRALTARSLLAEVEA